MGDDKCKEVRTTYDLCYQTWLDTDYLTGKVKGKMVPCEAQLKEYHECLKRDQTKAKYLEELNKFKEEYPISQINSSQENN